MNGNRTMPSAQITQSRALVFRNFISLTSYSLSSFTRRWNGTPFSSTTSSSHVFCCAHGDAFNSKSEIGGIQKSLDTEDRESVKSAPRCRPRCFQPEAEIRSPVYFGL